MNIALVVALIGGAIYIVGAFADHPAAVRFCDLGKYAFLAGMLGYLMGK